MGEKPEGARDGGRAAAAAAASDTSVAALSRRIWASSRGAGMDGSDAADMASCASGLLLTSMSTEMRLDAGDEEEAAANVDFGGGGGIPVGAARWCPASTSTPTIKNECKGPCKNRERKTNKRVDARGSSTRVDQDSQASAIRKNGVQTRRQNREGQKESAAAVAKREKTTSGKKECLK